MTEYFDASSLPFADGFSYRDGNLYCGPERVDEIAAHRQTPFYLYNIDAIVEKYRAYAEAFADLQHRTCFAVKANSNLSLLRNLAGAGCGMDVNSAGELYRVMKAGINPQSITMTGVGKTDRDLRAALEADILFLNAESEEECLRVNDIAGAMGKKVQIVLRLNPDVSAETHPYIATGLAEHKFGLGSDEAYETVRRLQTAEYISIVGFGMHLGSQLFTTSPYAEGLEKLLAFAKRVVSEFGVPLRFINIGGGMGVSYDDTTRVFPLDELAALIQQQLHASGMDVQIVSEPGRYLVANAGVLISKLEYIKKNAGNIFYIIDAGMNDLIRPALYDAQHKVLPVGVSPSADAVTVDVVGPVCESGDTFLKGYTIPEMQTGQTVAVFSAGAYGAVMSSRYNSRPLIEEVGLIGGDVQTIRKAETFDDMLRLEI